jgi:hypothetical protein
MGEEREKALEAFLHLFPSVGLVLALVFIGRWMFDLWRKYRSLAALVGAILPAAFIAAVIGTVYLGMMIASPSTGSTPTSTTPATAAAAPH